MENRTLDIERNKEIFEYEMTEVLTNLRGEFSKFTSLIKEETTELIEESSISMTPPNISKVSLKIPEEDVVPKGIELKCNYSPTIVAMQPAKVTIDSLRTISDWIEPDLTSSLESKKLPMISVPSIPLLHMEFEPNADVSTIERPSWNNEAILPEGFSIKSLLEMEISTNREVPKVDLPGIDFESVSYDLPTLEKVELSIDRPVVSIPNMDTCSMEIPEFQVSGSKEIPAIKPLPSFDIHKKIQNGMGQKSDIPQMDMVIDLDSLKKAINEVKMDIGEFSFKFTEIPKINANACVYEAEIEHPSKHILSQMKPKYISSYKAPSFVDFVVTLPMIDVSGLGIMNDLCNKENLKVKRIENEHTQKSYQIALPNVDDYKREIMDTMLQL